MKAPRLGSVEVSYSDRISHLPDDLLLQILSYISVKDAISTSLLSKRWKFLWKMMPTLDLNEYFCPNIGGSLRFDEFCGMYLKSHEAQVLTSLNIILRTHSKAIDGILSNIQSTLLKMTVNSSRRSLIRFPRCLTVCQTLVVMKLQNNILVDVVSLPVCFRSLKRLHLTGVKYSSRESFTTLLSACPVLEDLDLLVQTDSYQCLGLFTISVPSLQRLSICEVSFLLGTMFEINAPSLTYLKIVGLPCCFKFIEHMPKLAEAHVKAAIYHDKNKNLLRFLTSVERLSIHFCSSMVLDLTDIIFHRLLHLELHLEDGLQGNQILSLLKHTPNLQALKLNKKPLNSLSDQQRSVCKPDSVPECLTFHLETLEWRGYKGRPEDKEIADYILGNARCLNTAKISRYFSSGNYRHRHRLKKDLRIVEELKSIYMASTSCQFVIQRQHDP